MSVPDIRHATQVYRFSGRLVRSPFGDEPGGSEARSILKMCENDYRNALVFENDIRLPVLMSYSQHYALLADIVRCALAGLEPLEHVFVRFTSPYFLRLPGDVLCDDVHIVDDPVLAAQPVLRDGSAAVLCVSEGFRRDTAERSDNGITLTLHSHANHEANFRRFVESLRCYPFLHVDERRFTRDDLQDTTVAPRR